MQYQDFLLEEFRSRRTRNPHYSLRSYARDLGMPASKLSQNLRGLCGISVKKATKIAEHLQMHEDEKHLFLTLVESRHARSRHARARAITDLVKIREEKLSELNLEKFAVVRDWYHIAILEMSGIRGFRSDPGWIAARLGLPRITVESAIQRLHGLGLMAIEDGEYRSTCESLEFPGGVPPRAVRERHKQMLAKAVTSLEQGNLERCEVVSDTFAVQMKDLPEIRRIVREFQKRVTAMANSEDKDAVYALGIQLFPLVEPVE